MFDQDIRKFILVGPTRLGLYLIEPIEPNNGNDVGKSSPSGIEISSSLLSLLPDPLFYDIFSSDFRFFYTKECCGKWFSRPNSEVEPDWTTELRLLSLIIHILNG